jgi:antirestriction protein
MDALADELDELREARADGDEDYDEDRLEALEDLEEQLFAEGDLHRAAASGPFIAEGRSFEDYAMEVAEETLGIDVSAWPAFHIDWERAARDLQMDYTAVEFEGTTYLYQA